MLTAVCTTGSGREMDVPNLTLSIYSFRFFHLNFCLYFFVVLLFFITRCQCVCISTKETHAHSVSEWVSERIFFIYLKILILHRGKFSPILCELMVASHWCLLLTVVIPSAQIQKQRKQLYCSKQNHIAVLDHSNDEKQFNVYQQQIEKKIGEKKRI